MVLLVADVPTDPFTQQLVRYVRQYGLEGRGVVRLVPKAQLLQQGIAVPHLPFCIDDATGQTFQDVACVSEVQRRGRGLPEQQQGAAEQGAPAWFPRPRASSFEAEQAGQSGGQSAGQPEPATGFQASFERAAAQEDVGMSALFHQPGKGERRAAKPFPFAAAPAEEEAVGSKCRVARRDGNGRRKALS